jgi:hypothetical protein
VFSPAQTRPVHLFQWWFEQIAGVAKLGSEWRETLPSFLECVQCFVEHNALVKQFHQVVRFAERYVVPEKKALQRFFCCLLAMVHSHIQERLVMC